MHYLYKVWEHEVIHIELFRIVYKFALEYQIEECVEVAQFSKL